MKHLKKFENDNLPYGVKWMEYFSPEYIEKNEIYVDKCLELIELFEELRKMEDDGTFLKEPEADYKKWPPYHDNLLMDMSNEIGDLLVSCKLSNEISNFFNDDHYSEEKYDAWYHDVKYPEKGEARKFNF